MRNLKVNCFRCEGLGELSEHRGPQSHGGDPPSYYLQCDNCGIRTKALTMYYDAKTEDELLEKLKQIWNYE